MKKTHWLVFVIFLLFSACEGCRPRGIEEGLHKFGIEVQCKKVTTVATINGWPAIQVDASKQEDHLPDTAMVGAILVPKSLKDSGKKKAISAITAATVSKEPTQPNTIQDLEEGIIINHEGPKSKVVSPKQEDFSFIVSFIDPARRGLKPNTEYHVDVTAAAKGSKSPLVFSSQDACPYTTPDFSDNNPRKLIMQPVKPIVRTVEGDKEYLNFSFEAEAKALPSTGTAFFLLVQEGTDDLFVALETIIKERHKTSKGLDLHTLTDPSVGFVPIDPAHPTLILLPLGGTREGDTLLEVVERKEEFSKLSIPKGVTYNVHGLVYEPEGKYTVSIEKDRTIKVPAAEATLTMKKVAINKLIAEAVPEGTVDTFELSLEGSVTNQKHTYQPRPYFVFHKSDTANATQQELKDAVNKCASTIDGFCEHGDFIVYGVKDTIAHDQDAKIEFSEKNAVNAKEHLQPKNTYQVYLAIKDDSGNGGTTLVGDTPMALKPPCLSMQLTDTDIDAKSGTSNWIELYDLFQILRPKATITHVQNLERASHGILFVDDPTKVVASLKKVADKIQKCVKAAESGEFKLAMDTTQHLKFMEVGGKKCFYRVAMLNEQITKKKYKTPEIKINVLYPYIYVLWQPETDYYPVYWTSDPKSKATFYTPPTIRFKTAKKTEQDTWDIPYKASDGRWYKLHSTRTKLQVQTKDGKGYEDFDPSSEGLDKEQVIPILQSIMSHRFTDKAKRKKAVNKLLNHLPLPPEKKGDDPS